MRTDIPAFYSKWFLNRLHEGYVLVRNPYEPGMVTRYRLNPEVVDLIGFCSKNPAPMLPHLHELRDYGQYWFVTITPYGEDIEPRVPPKEQVMETFKRLSDTVGPKAVAWRYDPILLTETYTMERQLSDFAYMARSLSGYTTSCVISFVDLYQKVRRNFPELQAPTYEQKMELGKQMVQIVGDCGMTLRPCAEGNDLEAYGADCGGCMTVALYEKALGCHLNAPKRRNQRGGECACLLGTDIGAYDTCGHLCRYCYANTDAALVQRNMLRHDHFHPGAHTGQGIETGISLIAEALNRTLKPDMTTTVLLETMAGKGSEVGHSFEELREIIDRVDLKEKLGVCFDTCHTWDASYDLASDLDGVLTAFDRIIGLEWLKAVHFNDSKNECGSHKDRHEKLGQGCLGTETLKRIALHPALAGRPFILETPNDDEGYKEEIQLMLQWLNEA